ncbi:unnamed protein product [Schistocephalus solidus]|uniref:Ig-like domain-containing protein n=1 Tax=Schistocephalus solidus TaxID=70667 RepID=A0A183T365_SCHSO|nr:unnamed protein product [Schistocephalus solidus]
MECIVNGYPDPDLYWFKGVYDPQENNVPLYDSDRYELEKTRSYGAVALFFLVLPVLVLVVVGVVVLLLLVLVLFCLVLVLVVLFLELPVLELPIPVLVRLVLFLLLIRPVLIALC